MLPVMQGYSAQAAYLIEPCVDALTYSYAVRGKDKTSKSPLLNREVLFGGAKDQAQGTSADQAQYCLEGGGGLEGSIYRRADATDTYLMAFADAGASAIVKPEYSVADLLKDAGAEGAESTEATKDGDDAKAKRFTLIYKNAREVVFFRSFLSLPHPSQTAQAVYNEEPIMTVNRPLGDETATITVFSKPDDIAPKDADDQAEK